MTSVRTLAAALVALALVVVGGAAGPSSAVPVQDDAVPVQDDAVPVQDDADFTWTIVDKGQDCPTEAVSPDGDKQSELRRDQKICLVGLDPDAVTFDEPLTTIDETNDELAIDEAWKYTFGQAVEAKFGVANGSEGSVVIVPDVTVTVRWEVIQEVEAAQAGTEADVAAESDVAGDGTEPGSPPPQVIGSNGIRKVIEVSGDDMQDLSDEIRERLKIEDPVPPDLVSSMLPENGELNDATLSLPLDEMSSVRYRLDPSAAAGATTEARSQETWLTFDGDQLEMGTTPEFVVVKGAQVSLSVSSDYDEDDAGAKLVVTVTNLRDEPLVGTLLIAVEGTGATSFAGFRDVSDVWTIKNGTTLTWTIEEGLPAGKALTRTAVGLLTKDASESVVTWQATVERELPDDRTERLDDAEAQTTVPAASDGESTSVEFDAGELVQLIAFVVTLALIAIIIGAIMRRSRGRDDLIGEEANAQRKHEESIFRAYTEGIIVLVILVAILVLALQESLQAESAASLIGVIAGYALGQRRGGG